MKIPGVFWVALIVGLQAALPPFLAQWFPAATVWWSAAIIMAVDVIALAVKIAWPHEAAEIDGMARGAEPVQPDPAWKKVVFGA